MKTMKKIALLTLVMWPLGLSASFASPLIFEGKNIALFSGANPGSLSALKETVIRPADPNAARTTSASSAADLIQRSIISQISTTINNQIFDTNNPSGSYDLGNGNLIEFVRTGGNIVITLTNPSTGTTVITVPDI